MGDVEYIQGKLRRMKMGDIEYDHFTNGDPFTIHKGEPSKKNLISEVVEAQANKKAKVILPPETGKVAEAGEGI